MASTRLPPRVPKRTHIDAEVLTEADKALLPRATAIPYGSTPPATIHIDERKLLQAALDEPYEGTDPAKFGLSKIACTAKEVATQASNGVPWAVDFVFNRLYGRPKQTISTTNLQMTLKEYLQQLAAPKAQAQEAETHG